MTTAAPPEFVAQLEAADGRVAVVAGHLNAALRDLRRASRDLPLAPLRPHTMLASLPIQEFAQRLDHQLTPALHRSLIAGARASAPTASERFQRVIRVKAALGFGFDFDKANEHAIRFARTQSSALVRQVSDETRRAIQAAIARGVAGNATPDQVERNIKDVIGLNRRLGLALINYRDGLVRSGMSGLKVGALVSRYRDRLLKYRAMLIARTETMRSVNMGQQALWLAARDAGLFEGQTVLRRWIVTPDDRLCPFCAAMSGQVVGLEERFRSGLVPYADGSGVRSFPDVLTPPLHPLCRCTMSLEFRDEIPTIVEPPPTPVETWEAVHIDDPIESAIAWKDGEIVMEKTGAENNVEFNKREREAILYADLFTHNHPAGTSLSIDDIVFAMTHGIREMRAVGTDVDGQRYRYIWRFPETKFQAPSLEGQFAQVETKIGLMVDLYETINAKVRLLGGVKLAAGDFGSFATLARAAVWHTHEVNKRLVKAFGRGMEYERVPI